MFKPRALAFEAVKSLIRRDNIGIRRMSDGEEGHSNLSSGVIVVLILRFLITTV